MPVEKIEFTLFSLQLLEPNAFITDSLLGILALVFAASVHKFSSDDIFFRNWRLFFLMFGLSTIFGGTGHLLYNYLGLPGKIPTWIFGVAAVYFVEIAMISVHPQKGITGPLKTISFIKAMLIFVALALILAFADPANKVYLGILVVIINTGLGASLSAGVLALFYLRLGLSHYYRYYFIGVLIILPSALVFLLDINPYQWFDKNDISHFLMAGGIIFFYLATKGLHNEKSANASVSR